MTKPGSVRDCELCIVGAGYAGLNGLNAAAKYLKPGDRVVVVDEKSTWGGQWLEQYDFVRLHQPYRLFTAGDQPWTLEREAWHLATKREILEHLSTVPAISAGQLSVEPLFRHRYTGRRLVDGRVEIEATPVKGDGGPIRVRARRMLDATGLDIEPLPPFPVSSTRVRSVGVSDPVLASPEFRESDAPIYVIGSGKTAMDCVLELARTLPRERPIRVLIGSGMWFFLRDNAFPSGIARYVKGKLTGDVFLRIVTLFDGQNERAVFEQLGREGLAHTVFGDGGNIRYGLLSLAERAEVLARVDEVIRGHLVDVDGSRMTIRGPEGLGERPIEEGAWLVNCTSHFRAIPHTPILADEGLVLSPQFSLGFTGTSAYFLTHLWYRDGLAEIAPRMHRAVVDVEPKLRFGPHLGLMVLANMAMVTDRLPFSVSARFLGDFNKWYPIHRQVPMLARVLANKKMCLEKAERLLPTRFSDPIEPTAPEANRGQAVAS